MGKDFLKWGENNCDEWGNSLKGSGWGERRVETCVLKEDKQAAGEMTQASPTQPPHILAPASCPSRLLCPLGLFHWLSLWGLRSGSLPPKLGLFVGMWCENRRWSQPSGFLSALLCGILELLLEPPPAPPTTTTTTHTAPPRQGSLAALLYLHPSVWSLFVCLAVLIRVIFLVSSRGLPISCLGPERDGKLGAG